jgi:DnaJ family protein B protein 12
MEGNREEAERALHIARQHREQAKYTSALKFARKSLSLYETPAAHTLIKIIEKDIAVASASARSEGGPADAETSARTSGAEVHPSAAGTHHRPGHGGSSTPEASSSKKREFTPEQHKLVKRITSCKVTEYYEILSGGFLASAAGSCGLTRQAR